MLPTVSNALIESFGSTKRRGNECIKAGREEMWQHNRELLGLMTMLVEDGGVFEIDYFLNTYCVMYKLLSSQMEANQMEPEIGATGEKPMPDAPLGDLGGLYGGLFIHKPTNTIILNFGKPLSYVMMNKEEAKIMATALLAKAEELK